MDTYLVNKQGMFMRIVVVLQKFITLVNSLPALKKHAETFSTLVDTIGTQLAATSKGTQAKTNVKHVSMQTMAKGVTQLVRLFHSYAFDHQMLELAEQTDIYESTIIDVRDDERAKYADGLVDLVEQYKTSLAEVGVTDEKIAAAHALVAGYSASLADKNSAVTGNSATRALLMANFQQADDIIEHHFNSLIPSASESDPQFLLEYQAAAVLHDTPATHEVKTDKNNGDAKPPQSDAEADKTAGDASSVKK
ncbi:MAG TPA: hypothetical protein VMU30_03800 [Bacteroidota bacterium]|nr:hypothetical protein [Bacteroidota bacterium]